MITSSRYLMNGSPTRCTFCNGPFHPCNGFVEFWRSSNGDHFCSEFCADYAEEAHFRKRHAATLGCRAPITHPRPLYRIADLGCRHSPFGWHQPGVPQRREHRVTSGAGDRGPKVILPQASMGKALVINAQRMDHPVRPLLSATARSPFQIPVLLPSQQVWGPRSRLVRLF